MSNTISQNPMLAKLLVNPDVKSDPSQSGKGGVADLVRAQQALHNAQSSTPSTTDNDQFMQSPQGLMAAARMQSVESSYQYSETMSMQLTTKEGDTVSVDFKQLYAQYQSYTQQQSAESGPSGVRYFESKEALEVTAFEEQFAFSVNGDLNEDELNAIFDVFEQVDKLANNFFGGNIEKALSQAMELEIDYDQLQNFQLNLTQTQATASRYQQAAMSEYENVQDKTATDEAEEYGVTLSNLPEYLQQWQAAVEKLDEQFENAQVVLDEILSSVVSQRFPESFPELDERLGWFERVQAFHQRLAGYAEQSKESEQVSVEADEVAEVTEESAVENHAENREEARKEVGQERS